MNVSLTANGLVFKIYRDHFGTIPVEVSGNSPQPKPTDPPGGEQPVVNAGSDTFPLDVVAAWTADHRTLTMAILKLAPMPNNHLNLTLPVRHYQAKARFGGWPRLKAMAKTLSISN